MNEITSRPATKNVWQKLTPTAKGVLILVVILVALANASQYGIVIGAVTSIFATPIFMLIFGTPIAFALVRFRKNNEKFWSDTVIYSSIVLLLLVIWMIKSILTNLTI